MDQDQTPVFVVDDNPTVRWPVTLRLPADGGQFADYRFRVNLRVLSEDRYVELLDKHESPKDASTAAMLAENAERFREFISDWDDGELKDARGNVIPFSVAKLRELVTGPYGGPLSQGLWLAITEVRYKERLGNFAPPPAIGADTAGSEA
jgi:hypothetical protein